MKQPLNKEQIIEHSLWFQGLAYKDQDSVMLV